MNLDNKLMMEALESANYDKLAQTKSKLHLALSALQECYKHFSSEPTDPGHPHLIKVVKSALDEIQQKEM